MRARVILRLALATTMVLVAMLLITPGKAQAPATQPQIPQWQIEAGGQAKFEVTSVKQNKSGAPPSGDQQHSNIQLGPFDNRRVGGLYSGTNFLLIEYIDIAYKLTLYQDHAMRSQLPKWAITNRYDIQASVAGNPTKDQMRLMMQALLADRFKLAAHRETRQGPVLALLMVKPGATKPQLQPAQPCDSGALGSQTPAPAALGGVPAVCGAGFFGSTPSPGRIRIAGRSMSMSNIADFVSGWADFSFSRPVLDRTGLAGNFDFSVEFVPDLSGAEPPQPNFQPDPTGPTLMEALKDQLGLKVDSRTGPVDVLVIDHIEEPTPN
jgi:uncharacterized protein (TIGR03435 family)